MIPMRSIAIASGKGGVGKTSISLNLGLALAQAGKRVVVVDADIAMANLGILLGAERAPISLHNVLIGEVEMRDAVYDGPFGMKYVPAGLSTDKLRRIDYARLKSAVEELGKTADYVIVDCPSGLAIDAETAVKSAREAIIITTPEPSSLADALKVKNYAERSNVNILGAVCNMVSGDRSEVSAKDVATVLEASLLESIPIDTNVRRASAAQEPVLVKFPNTPFSLAMRSLASKVSGERVAGGIGVKKHWLQEIIGQLLAKIGL